MAATDIIEIAKARTFIASGVGRTIRQAAGLSLAEIGQAVGADQSTVWRWEAGQRRPRGELAVRYAALLRDLMSDR